MKNIRTYSELMKLKTFEERLNYLMLDGVIGEILFGSHRHLNQALYRSKEWKDCRREIILRDHGCDLACDGYEISGRVLVHHMNPISAEDILLRRTKIFDPENLITISHKTHEAITYGSKDFILTIEPVNRKKNDTCLWR